jgi:SAM-dependent methyltransferase
MKGRNSTVSNTAQSFRDKWEQNKQLAFAETLREGSDIFNWLLKRNGWDTPDGLRAYLSGKKRILDAGCGNGRVTALLRRYSSPGDTEIVGIDLVSASVAQENLKDSPNVRIQTKDLLGDLKDIGLFDFIYCQEVLHHTIDPCMAFLNLCQLLRPDGEIAIYVYRKKAPVREFVDDHIREKISCFSYEDAIQVCRQITALGKTLADLSLKVKIPAVDMLEIPAGEYDIQRFLYYFFLKCFWNPDLSFEENAAINYDWYHPQLCSRHTLEEVQGWFREAELKIMHEYADFYGITVRGRR